MYGHGAPSKYCKDEVTMAYMSVKRCDDHLEASQLIHTQRGT